MEIEEWVREMNWKPFEKKIWLSSPTMHGDEQKWVNDAFEKNWITTAGESEILEMVFWRENGVR